MSAGNCLAGAGLDLDGAAVQLLEADHAVVGDHLHAMPLDVALDEARDLRVQRGQDVIGLLDEGHVEPEMDQVLRRLETDEPAANDHRAAHGLDHLNARVVEHPREKGRALLDPLADRLGVRHGAHVEDPRQINARQGRMDRSRAGRQHELVVGLGRDLAGLHVAQLHGLLLWIDGNRLAVRARINREHGAKHLLGPHQEARFLFNHAADVVGQTAVRVRDIRPAFHHEDFGLFVQPAQARRTRRAARHSTNDDDFHITFLLFVSSWNR